MPLTTRLSTAKAYVSALSTGIAAALAALLPAVNGPWSTSILVVLAVLASYGVTYATPNAPAADRRGRGPLSDLRDPGSGAPPA